MNLLMIAAALAATPAHQTRTCEKLTSDLDNLSKSLAMNFAEGIADRRRSGSTVREAEYNNLLTRVRLTMDLMRDNHCRMPTSVPTGEEYVGSALKCRTDMLEAQLQSATLPESCNISKWQAKK